MLRVDESAILHPSNRTTAPDAPWSASRIVALRQKTTYNIVWASKEKDGLVLGRLGYIAEIVGALAGSGELM